MVINFFVIYPAILLLIFIACAFCGKSTTRDNYILLFAIVLAFLFMALRKDYTPDYWEYEDQFEVIHSSGYDNDLHSEIGYQWLNIVLPSYRMVIVIASLAFLSGIYIFFKTFIPSSYWGFSFILLFTDTFAYLINLSAIRNSIAIAALLWGVYLLSKRQKIPFIILILLGSLFHASVLIFIPLVFFGSSKPKLNLQLWMTLFIIYVVLSVIMPGLWGNIANLMFSEVDALSGYLYYVEDLKGTSRGLSYLLLFFILFFNLKTIAMNDLTPNDYMCLKLALIWFLIVFSPIVGMISRYYVYVDFFLFASVPVVMRNTHKHLFKYAYAFGILLYFVLQSSTFFKGDTFNDFYSIYKTISF